MLGVGNSEQQREPLKAPVRSILSAVLLLVLCQAAASGHCQTQDTGLDGPLL